VAFVRTTGGNLGDLARALEPTLPRFKIPVSFHEWPHWGGEMKVDRRFFRERALRWDREGRN
jgi:hypothetical protein